MTINFCKSILENKKALFSKLRTIMIAEWINSFFERVSFTSKAFLEWKDSKNFGNCREAGNRFDTTASKKRDNDGIPSQMDGIRMLFSFSFSFFFQPSLSLCSQKNRDGSEGLSGILTPRRVERKGNLRTEKKKKRLEWRNCRVILIIKAWWLEGDWNKI